MVQEPLSCGFKSLILSTSVSSAKGDCGAVGSQSSRAVVRIRQARETAL